MDSSERETARDVLVKRFKAMEGNGLVDVKFLLRNPDEATGEQVCREVNDLLDAVERGESVPLDFKDSRRS